MPQQPESWDLIATETIADCRIFAVEKGLWRRRTDQREATFYRLDNPEWVNIIPVTKSGDVVLIEQFRQGTRRIALELPGGMVDQGESPADSAARELAEETGCQSNNWTYLGKSHPNPAYQQNSIHHFLAENCEPTGSQSFDEHESIVVRTVPLSEIPSLILRRSITHSLVVSAFYFLEHYNRIDENISA